MAVQTSYGYATPKGIPGGIYDLYHYPVDSRFNEEDSGKLRFGVGEFGLGLGALISKLGRAVFPLRQTVGIFGLAAFELSAALIELRLALGKLCRSGIKRGLTAREALVGRSLLGSKPLLARRKLLRHARGFRIDLSDARLKLNDARFDFSFLGLKLRLLLLEL